MISLLQSQTMAQKQKEGKEMIPVFTVFKNGAYVKNIILRNPFSVSESESNQEDSSLMVGRHHDCDIVLEHPSISRYHLQLKFNGSSKNMSVTDLSSVHGTMISGKKIKPRIYVQVEEGDVLKFGASTRLYKLKWISAISDLEAEGDTKSASSSFSKKHEKGNGEIIGTDEQDQWHASAPPMEPEYEYCSLPENSLADLGVSAKETHSRGVKEKPSTNIWLRRCLSASVPRIRTLSKKDKVLDMVLYSGVNDLCDEGFSNFNQVNNNVIQDLIDFQETERVIHNENLCLRRCLSSSEPRIRMITEKDKELDMVLYAGINDLQGENDANRNQPENGSNVAVTDLKEAEILVGKEQSVTEMTDWVENPTMTSVSEASIQCDEQGTLPESCFNNVSVDESVFVSDGNPSKQVLPQCISKPNDEVAYEEDTVEDKENQVTQDFHRIQLNNTIASEKFQPMTQGAEHVILPESCFSRLSEEGNIDNDYTQIPLFSLKSNEEVTYEEDSVEDNEIHLDTTAVSENLQAEIVFCNDRATLSHEYGAQFESEFLHNSLGVVGDEEEENAFLSDEENLTPKPNSKVAACASMVEARAAQGTKDNNFLRLSLSAGFPKNESEDIFQSKSSTKKVPSHIFGSRRRLCYGDLDATESSTTPMNDEQAKHQSMLDTFRQGDSVINYDIGDAFLADKENLTPQIHSAHVLRSSLKLSSKKLCYGDLDATESSTTPMNDEQAKQQSILDTFRQADKVINYDIGDAFLADKENLTPQIHSAHVLRSSLKLSSKKLIMEAESCRVITVAGLDMNQSEWQDGSFCNSITEDMFSSDKENVTPMLSRALKSKPRNSSKFKEEVILQEGSQERVPFQNLLVSSPMKTKEFPRRNRVPFQSLLERSPDNARRSPSITASRTTNKSCSSVDQPLDQEAVEKNMTTTMKKKWYMVVDTSCLLNPKSRRSLMLMEGLKGTQLIVPRMVIRELDSMKNRPGRFRRKSPASLVMQWIEECMVKMSWWIHVQSSSECVPVAATPPVSPHMQLSQGGTESSGCNAASFATTTQIPFSSYGSFAEIVSPTADDHILDCALLFKRMKTDGHLILLTKEVGLKIKAMAEGIICESPEEFCQSLVNPYSERFLWLESTPRGPTWSSTDVGGGLRGICHEPVTELNRKVFTGGAKGLKLVLHHNHHYGQINSAA